MLGKFNADGIQVECETDSSDLWIVDADGVYIEQSPMHSIMQEECLNAINAKYGTNFTTLTMQKVTSVAIGDDCPDWNAYEKIEIPAQKIAVKLQSAGDILLICGTLSNKVFNMLTNGNGSLVAKESGIVDNYEGPGIGASSYIISLLSNFNLEATEVVQTIVDYPVGEQIPQWEQYEQYK